MIESLLLEQLTTDSNICGLLAQYGCKPAIFYQNAPSDQDPNWEDGCYPRIDFTIDRSSDPERQTTGSLLIDVWVSAKNLSASGGNMDREIETILVTLISGTFYSPDVKLIIGAEWVQTTTYAPRISDSNAGKSPVEIFGLCLIFDLIDFPSQKTTDPDPIQGANAFIKEHYPDMIIIGEDEIPPIWKPSDENPAMFWRFKGYEGDIRQSYSVNWYLAHLALHVFTDSIQTRNTWLKAATELMNMFGEIILLDYSPMFIKKLKILHEGDTLREGQALITAEFGVLVQQRKEKAQIPLNKTIVRKKGVKSCPNKLMRF